MQIDFVQVVSILANVGVVLGFIFLVIEVRQNNQMNRTNAWNSLLRSGIEFNDHIMVTPDLADILAKGNNNEELTDGESIRLQSFAAGSLQRVWFDYRQIKTGIISAEELRTRIPTFKMLFTRFPVMRTIWEETRGRYSEYFQSFIDGYVLSESEDVLR